MLLWNYTKSTCSAPWVRPAWIQLEGYMGLQGLTPAAGTDLLLKQATPEPHRGFVLEGASWFTPKRGVQRGVKYVPHGAAGVAEPRSTRRAVWLGNTNPGGAHGVHHHTLSSPHHQYPIASPPKTATLPGCWQSKRRPAVDLGASHHQPSSGTGVMTCSSLPAGAELVDLFHPIMISAGTRYLPYLFERWVSSMSEGAGD